MLSAIIFVLGYVAIAFEHQFKVSKAASALITGVLCWTVYVLQAPDAEVVGHQLESHTAEIASILFFLLGAMVVVELIDAHNGFEIVTNQIKTTNKRRLLWLTGMIAFFLSAVLDNLTTTIVMVSLLRKLIDNQEDRLRFAGLVVIAANAGGAFSPMGDVTTTMLWIGGQISAVNIIVKLFIPSILCLIVPIALMSRNMKGKISAPAVDVDTSAPNKRVRHERNLVFGIGLGSLLFVPVFKTVTHLPPYMAMLLGLGVIWMLTEIIHAGKEDLERNPRSVAGALQRIDTSSILFFMGILLAVSALQSQGFLKTMAEWLDQTVGNQSVIAVALGFLSAIVDNVPLVAAAQGMYSMTQYPTDHYLWELLAYTTGTGGSMLIIGSAAGVAAMGMERIDFFWYLKKIAPYALVGYLAGALFYILVN